MSKFARASVKTISACNTIQLPAIISIQGKRKNIAVTLPCNSVGKFVRTTTFRNKVDVMPKKLLNRFLDKNHVKDIEKYISKEEEFIIPPISLVAQESLVSSFRPMIYIDEDENLTIDELLEKYGAIVGILVLPLDYVFICLDGNHRVKSLYEISLTHPEILKNSSILLNIIIEENVLKIRQDFVDINSNTKPTTASINTLFDTRNKLSYIVAKLIEDNKYLNDTTELISTSVGKASKDIYTTNNIKNAVIELSGVSCQSSRSVNNLAETLEMDEEKFKEAIRRANIFFNILKQNQSIEKCIRNYDNIPDERQKSIILGGVGLIILSRVCAKAFDLDSEENSILKLKEIMNYDWYRTNEFLKAKILNENGKIISSSSSIAETSNVLIEKFYSNLEEVAVSYN